MNLPQMPPVQRELLGLERIAMASEAIVNADVVGKRISSEQQWALAPLHGILSCCAPGFYAQGSLGRVNFPSWLGRNSTSIKRHRLLRECTSHMQAQVSGSKGEVRVSYVPALRDLLLTPLLDGGADGIPRVLEIMDKYSLSKDDFDAIMEFQLLVGPNPKAAFSAVPANVKAALTRKYNAEHHGVKKVVRGMDSKKERFTEGGSEEEDVEEEEEDAEAALVKPAASSNRNNKNGKAPVKRARA